MILRHQRYRYVGDPALIDPCEYHGNPHADNAECYDGRCPGRIRGRCPYSHGQLIPAFDVYFEPEEVTP